MSVHTGQYTPLASEVARETAAIARDLGSRYLIEDYVGRGGFATVWKGTDVISGEAVAIKRFEGRGSKEDRRNFYRELRALFLLHHPRIVRIINLTEAASGSRYLILEFCPGGNLRMAISQASRAAVRCSVERALDLVEQIVDGLAEAHRHGMVHRDLKPENILFDERISDPSEADPIWFGGRASIKIVDFGLARALRPDAQGNQPLDGLSGSPAYMAPEQFMGGITKASDFYSLGVILFELVHGRLPFEGTVEQLVQRHLREPPPIDPDLHPALIELLRDLLLKDPNLRLADPTELRRRIVDIRKECAQVAEADPKWDSFTHSLSIHPLKLFLDPAEGQLLLVASDGLVSLEARTGTAEGMTSMPTLDVATRSHDGGILLASGRRVFHYDRETRLVRELGSAKNPIRSIGSAGPVVPLVLWVGDALIGHASLLPKDPIWERPVRGRDQMPVLLGLPNGQTAFAEGPSRPAWTLLDGEGGEVFSHPLPGPCLALERGNEDCLLARLWVDGTAMGYRLDLATGEALPLDGTRGLYRFSLVDERVSAVLEDGTLLVGSPTGRFERVGRLDLDGGWLSEFAADGKIFIATAHADGLTWLVGRVRR